MPDRLTDLLLCAVFVLALCGAIFPEDTADWLRQTWSGLEVIGRVFKIG